MSVYLTVLAWAAASYVVVGGIAWMWRLRAERAVRTCGGLAFGLYYWFAAPGLAAAYGGAHDPSTDGSPVGPWIVRAAALGLLALWLVRSPQMAPITPLMRIER